MAYFVPCVLQKMAGEIGSKEQKNEVIKNL